MGRTLKKFLGTGFSTLEESPLGQIINLLHKKLQDVQQIAQQDKDKEPSIQNGYTVKQLAVLRDIFERIQALLSYYSEGNKPSGFYLLPFGKKIIGLFILLSDAKDFITAANSFYKEIQNYLSDAITNSLHAQKIKQFTKEKIPGFVKQLKLELKKNKDICFIEARQIPGFDLEKFYQDVDQAIDDCDFQRFTKSDSLNKEELATNLSQLIKKEFFATGNYMEYEFQISHQTTYEVIVEAIELLSLVPQNIDELISFLKPEIFTLNLREGMLVELIPDSYANLKIAIEHTPSTTSKYRYRFTEGHGFSQTYDAKALYKKYIGEVIGIFMSALTGYLKNYAQTPHVKSEFARTQLIQDFITRERQLDLECFTARENFTNLINYQVPSETHSDAKLHSLEKAIAAIDIHLYQITNLHQRKTAYEQKNLGDLLAPHPDLVARLEGLNPPYSGLPLPDIIIAKEKFSGKFAVVSVKKELAIKISALNQLDADSQALLEKKAQLNKQYSEEVQVWKLHEIVSHQDRNTKFLHQLQYFVQAGDELNQQKLDVNRSLGIDAQIHALSDQLKNIAQHRLTLLDYLHEVQALQEQVNNSAKCPELLVKIDPTINNLTVKCYEGSREQARVCITKLQEIDRVLLDRKALINNSLLKAQAAKASAETIKLSNTETIESLLSEKENQHAQLLVKQKELIRLSLEKETCLHESLQAQYKEAATLTRNDPLIHLKEEFFVVRTKLLARVDDIKDKISKLRPQVQIDLLFAKKNFQSSVEINAALIEVKKLLDSHKVLKNKNSQKINANAQIRACLVIVEEQLQILISLALSIEQMEEVRSIFAQQEKEFSHDIKNIKKSLSTLEQEQLRLKTSLDILNVMVFLLKGNQTLNEEQITDLKIYEIDYNTENLLFVNCTKIFEKVNSAENKLKSLEFYQDSLVKKVADFVHVFDYETNIEKIKTELAKSREKIASFVQGICAKKLNDLLPRIKNSEEKLQTHLQSLRQFTEDHNPSLDKQLDALNSLLAEYTTWSDEIKPSLERSNLLQVDQSNFSTQKQNEEISAATQKLTLLDETSTAIQEQLLVQINLFIRGFNPVNEVQQKRTNFQFDESKNTYTNNVEMLNTVLHYLESFPSEKLKILQTLLEKLKTNSNSILENLIAVIKARDLLQEQVTNKHALNGKLAERIKARAALAQRFNTELDVYIEKRNQKYKYAFKDLFISSKDAEERWLFIDKLKLALTQYAESGNLEDSKQISAYIKKKKNQFFGFNLAPILNRLLLSIKEQDTKIPKQYMKIENEDTDILANCHVEALTKLEELRKANFDFAEGINLFYDKIILLEKYGQSIINNNEEHGSIAMKLAAALQKHVDMFVLGSGETFAGQDQSAKRNLFLDFQEDFMCQLHSQDDVMSQHNSFWRPFLVNLGLALVTLGLAIGAKLLLSKLLTGHASFFYSPEGLQHINAIHQVAKEEIAAPAA